MMGQELIIQEHKPMTATEIQSQVNAIQHVMKQVMKKDVHFGVIPGTKTPSLYKPGAEKIMATFRLSADPEVTDLSTEDQIRYLVKVRLTAMAGNFVGAGIGECSSNEEKYKWRGALCAAEFEDVSPDRKREKWNKGAWDNNSRSYGLPYKIMQIRTEPADLANTILKMAKKRALIDAVLTATAASDIFTQDVEDLPPEYIDGEASPAPQQQQRQQPPARQTGGDCASEAQVRLLKAKLSSSGKAELDLCKVFEIGSIELIPKKSVNDAIAWITE